MNKINYPFEITFTLPGHEQPTRAMVRHDTETFDLKLNGSDVALLNNGDNSWSSLKGELDQESVNLIGTAIEQYYQQLS